MGYSRLFLSGLICVASAFGQAPTITLVAHGATNIPPGLPNSGVAQGGYFIVKGTNLGPENFVVATEFPMPLNMAGTSVQVTVGGTTIDAIMYYTSRNQICALLPSRTPTGTGTVKVSYNGQSATAPIVVVKSNIGIFTRTGTGTGDAVATLPGALISPTNAPRPGEIIAVWATGLGPVSDDESRAAKGGDMPEIPVRAFVGGKEVEVLYRGRDTCCTATDTVYFKLPDGISGCAVSVILQIGDIVSNSTTIPIATSGRSCTPASPSSAITKGTYTFGGISLGRSVVTTPGIAGTAATTTRSDSATAIFAKITYATDPLGTQIDSTATSYGSCYVTSSFAGVSTAAPTSGSTIQYLDAGNAIAIAGPSLSRSMPKLTQSGLTYYQANLDQTATTLTAGTYTFTGPGGPDVATFTATYNMPAPLTWTNQSSISTVNRSAGVTVTWTGGDPTGYVQITGTSTFYAGTARDSGSTSFTCTARVSDQTFTVPSSVLLALPPTAPIPSTTITVPGSLSLVSSSNGTAFQAGGLQFGGVGAYVSYSIPATYQ